MADNFEAAVDGWAARTERQQTDLLHESLRGLDDVLVDKTPRVTGNLINSRALSTLGPPTIDWKGKKFRNPDDAVNNAVAGVEVGQTAWLGFRAPYAHKVEAKHAMMRLTAQLWRQIVDRAAGIVKSRAA